MSLVAAGLCDIGKKRKTNQDAIYLNSQKSLFVVADGMGGHNGGDIASQMAVNEIPKYILENMEKDATVLCEESILHTNQKIKKRGEEDEKLVGMGTTAVTFLFRGSNVYIANVGDSRAYLINNNKLYQLTRDHSLVQEKLNLGLYDRAQAAEDPQKNVLVRTVGFEDDIEVDVFSYKVSRNDLFLSCSDGLHGKVSDSDIVHIINRNLPDPTKFTQHNLDQTVKDLVDQANSNGGQDNIAIVLVAAI